jgi:hypothetical protein
MNCLGYPLSRLAAVAYLIRQQEVTNLIQALIFWGGTPLSESKDN